MRKKVREIGWATRGACRTSDPDLFFPLTPSVEHEARAKAVCAGCAVLKECRAYALRAGEPEGIWGGLTVEERRGMRFPAGWRRPAAS
ncbi:WhiB family redox-sensing transcriptional regulator [Streptosporangium becharense]|uniref:Transcriptional regulator WhiB n=1 Tax=Streptosporangium becharense TaxID=1816182 RepID=A0A7W9IG62_9ACTN|nr:WhiB family transcriptional regulator [Streptosporangium becharense]MBB2909554.1 WhiB family redox-sensing transcriptional regulator [Streptosporangium becharense]MBB5819489.1 WhiB family redox-sensing transcriptional regulator [Streptosporangium becharense]